MDEKPKRDSTPHPADIYPCPVCGGTEFTWGTPNSNGGVWFKEDGAIVGGVFGGIGLTLRECNRCGNVLWFTKK